jgi:hypothetical protein
MEEVTTMEPTNSIPAPTIVVGNHAYYTAHQLALVLGVPAYQVVDAVRDPASGLCGRKVGKQWIVAAEEFRRWVASGKFDYEPRARRVRTPDDDRAEAAAREAERLRRTK